MSNKKGSTRNFMCVATSFGNIYTRESAGCIYSTPHLIFGKLIFGIHQDIRDNCDFPSPCTPKIYLLSPSSPYISVCYLSPIKRVHILPALRSLCILPALTHKVCWHPLPINNLAEMRDRQFAWA